MSFDRLYSASEVKASLKEKIPDSTLRKDLALLKEAALLNAEGKGKGMKYKLTTQGLLKREFDPLTYCDRPIDNRAANTTYRFDFFEDMHNSFFSEEELEKMSTATEKYRAKLNVSPGIAKKEMERFVIELSWKSSKIEGNTYTLLDTELLIRDQIEAKGHPKDEATMILNHKKAFDFILESTDFWKHPKVREMEDIHRLLIQDLNVSFGLRTSLVGILGTAYQPLEVGSQIREAVQNLFEAVGRMTEPYSKALLLLVGISYIQPFEDGNKRTARLCANALLLAHQLAPLSYRSVEEGFFKASMLVFYEQQSIEAMKGIFQDQYLFSCDHYLVQAEL